MCGIAGVCFDTHEPPAAVATTMTRTLAHRGPDDEDVWVDEGQGVGLGHRRLAILDLSPTGRQPMVSRSGRYVMTFNGELYNYPDLRDELLRRGVTFRGTSDTEVLLEAVDTWGLRPTLQRANGMFALAVWDRWERRLQLARDRVGEKPLYYAWLGQTFVFGSELRAVRAHPGFIGQVNRDAIALLLRYSYIPAPYTIFEGVSKLPAGTIMTVSRESPSSTAPEPYWSLADVARAGIADPLKITDGEAVDLLDDLLHDAVRIRLQADVPVGAFLSGGIDSSTVTAIMQAESSRPVRTFTVGMGTADLDEAPAARAIAAHLRTDHTEASLTADDALALVPELPDIYDEPFADPSQIPTALISRVARSHVTVCLSGDGGDELLAGYNRYVLGDAAWRRMRHLPRPLRLVASGMLTTAGPGTLDGGAAKLAHMLGRPLPLQSVGTKAHKLGAILPSRSADDMYSRLISQWDRPGDVVLQGNEPQTALLGGPAEPTLTAPIDRMLYRDGVVTLPDDMLVKVDRATMAVGLESRLPLLDHRLVELAWRLPLDVKVRGGQGKWLLRRVLDRYVPPELVQRPKMGFDPPLADWLRGPLRDWGEDLLAPDRLRQEGFLQPELVRGRWTDHLSGRRNRDYALWSVLMFQAWQAAQRARVDA